MSVQEAASNPGGSYAAVLSAGLDVIDQDQTVVFTQYTRVVLPLDGFVFWVRSGILSPSMLLNASAFNTQPGNVGPMFTPVTTVTVRGSLHYESDDRQEESSSQTINSVRFTSKQEIDVFNTIGPTTMFVGSIDGLRFAFSRRGSFFRQADLWHYVGDAVYPTMASQIIDDPSQLDTTDVVVSNSLPIWLIMDPSNPIYPYPPGQRVPIFPSFAVPLNTPLPYCTAHVDESSQTALQMSPLITKFSSHYQLLTERVVVTFYGARHGTVTDYLDFVYNYSEMTDAIGFMNAPVVKDHKESQVEFGTLAMKKSITFEISYYQTRLRDIARQFILSATVKYLPNDYDGLPYAPPETPGVGPAVWDDFSWDDGSTWQ